MQFLTIEIRGRLFNLRADRRDAGFEIFRLAGAVHDDGVIFINLHLTCLSEVRQFHILQLHAEVRGDDFSTRQHRDVLQHFFSAIAKARSLDRRTVKGAAQFIQDEC